MSKEDKPLTRARLAQVYHYDPDTGDFYSIKLGRWLSGGPNGDGYIRMRVDGRNYAAHRLAWLFIHGKWPDGHIDHVNRNRSDNRIANLRDVTPRQNAILQRAKAGGSLTHIDVRLDILGEERMAVR